jgi:hypothetical protein
MSHAARRGSTAGLRCGSRIALDDFLVMIPLLI